MATSTTTVQSGLSGGLNRLLKQGDIVLSALMLVIVGMLIIPLPDFLLDIGLVLNITGSLLMLLIALYVLEPVQFNTFPSLLLVLTLFRLALNVSTARLILSTGEAGSVVRAFGSFVVQGNVIVGVIIFLILIVIQFVVITSGSGRISEVAARFTLDAMPGKQMAIDADLNSGLINEQQAKERRRGLQREADFYGTMDGASKFTRGDAIAGLVITVVNIIGGLSIGVFQRGQDIVQALQDYTLLTIGDGLVSAIPALLISTGTGVLVSRAASDTSLADTIGTQVLANARPIGIVSAMLALLAVTPGMPTLPFLVVSGLMGGLAYVLNSQKKKAATEAEAAQSTQTEAAVLPKGPENVMSLLKVDPMELEIGYRLIPLVDAGQGGDLLERITMIRRQTALKLGLVLPPIRVRDNLQLKPKEYRINLRGIEIARGEIQIDHYLAMDSGMAFEPLDGIQTTEPVFGLPAVWITEDKKEQAEIAGYTVFDASSVIATHLTEVIKAHAPEILTRQDVQSLLDNVKQDSPAVVGELVPDLLGVGDLQQVLQNLLRDQVSVRDLLPILEALATHARLTKDLDVLTEHARAALARGITREALGPDGALSVITIDPALEQTLAGAIQMTDQGAFVALEPGIATRVLRGVTEVMERVMGQGGQPVVLCSSKVRLVFRRLIERRFPTLMVMSYNEVVPAQTEVRSLGVIQLAS
ncbi:MAG: flagellar biosynthesis protein FlhA [bacterium]|nr:flagellar biosynthesis protein FlhA [bacterium]